MTHGWRRLTWAAAGLVGLPVIAVAVMLTGADTDAGRRLAERLVATLTGGQVVVSGMSGHFPDRLGIAHIELADTGGPWATVDDLRLDWSPRQLAAKIALVDRLAARRVSLLRLPASSGEPDGKPAALPIQVRVRDFSVERVDVAAPVAGVSASFSLQGAFRLASLDRGEAMLAVRRLDAPGTYRFDGALASGHIDAHLTAN